MFKFVQCYFCLYDFTRIANTGIFLSCFRNSIIILQYFQALIEIFFLSHDWIGRMKYSEWGLLAPIGCCKYEVILESSIRVFWGLAYISLNSSVRLSIREVLTFFKYLNKNVYYFDPLFMIKKLNYLRDNSIIYLESSYWKISLWPRCWIKKRIGGRKSISKSVRLLNSYMIWVQTGVSQVSFYL